MDIFNILKAFIAAITSVILSVTGHGIVATSTPQTVMEMASTTDAIVYQVAQTATTTEPSAVQQAYELGKAVGEMKAKAEMISKEVATATPLSTSLSTTPVVAPQPAPDPTPIITQPTQTIMTPTPIIASAPVSQARIEIMNPIPTKGLGRQHVASSTVQNEDNYVVLGAIVYDAEGKVDKTAVVTISATDDTQNKVENGSGELVTIYTDGVKEQVYGYVYSYDFKTAGDHTITFSANGLSKEVVINAK